MIAVVLVQVVCNGVQSLVAECKQGSFFQAAVSMVEVVRPGPGGDAQLFFFLLMWDFLKGGMECTGASGKQNFFIKADIKNIHALNFRILTVCMHR